MNTVKREQLEKHLEVLLTTKDFNDYCPNGLQVEGKEQIAKIVTGVTCSQELIDFAVVNGADAVIVHHGFFWKNEASPIVGMKARRVKSLMINDINLFAYHLPLDAHPQYGNNVQLIKQFNFSTPYDFHASEENALVWVINFEKPVSAAQLSEEIACALERQPLLVDVGKPIKRLALCTGGAQSYIGDAFKLGVDAFLSGEVSEPTYYDAVENGIHYFAAGHHATERYGVKALGESLSNEYGIEVIFFDGANPV